MILHAEDPPVDAAQTKPFWDQVIAWVVDAGAGLLKIAIILVVCFIIAVVLRLVIRRLVKRIVSRAKTKANVTDTRAIDRSPLTAVRLVQRTRTLGSVLQNVVNITVVVVALLLIVTVIDPGVLGSLTLLSAAIGAGLGFGAQNIIKDVLNGIFIVAEDQIGIGDVVDLGLASGVVEYVSVRITHVRDVNGTVWYVRNGEITRIGNVSQGWSRVIVDVAVDRDTDIATAQDVMLKGATALAEDPKWRTRVIGKPELWGLESAGDTLVLRIVQKTRPSAKDDVAPELRLRLFRALEKAGVDSPSLESVMPQGFDGAQRVLGASPPITKPTPVPDPPAHPTWRSHQKEQE